MTLCHNLKVATLVLKTFIKRLKVLTVNNSIYCVFLLSFFSKTHCVSIQIKPSCNSGLGHWTKHIQCCHIDVTTEPVQVPPKELPKHLFCKNSNIVIYHCIVRLYSENV